MTSVISPAGTVPHEHASSTILRTSQPVVIPTAVSHDSGSSLAQTSDIPPRKRRADEYQEPPAQTMEHQQSITDEETPFTEVIYKKTRKAGIPVLFKLNDPSQSFWKVNPNKLAQEIVATSQEKVLSQRIDKNGGLTVTVASAEAANNLLKLNALAGIKVDVVVPQSYSKNLGKIWGVPLDYSDDQLGEYLRDDGVISAQRQMKFTRREDGPVTKHPLTTVILKFREDLQLPARIKLGFHSFPVQEHCEAPTQCYNCQRYGHLARDCRSSRRCKICAGPHHHKECPTPREPQCANCGSRHVSTYAGCIRKQAAHAAKKNELFYGKPTSRKAPAPNPDVIKASDKMTTQNKTSRPTFSDVLQGIPSGSNTTLTDHKTRQGSSHVIPPNPKATADTEEEVPSHVDNRRRTSSRTAHHIESAHPDQESSAKGILHMFLPLMMEVIKEIIKEYPKIGSKSSIKALLAMEPLLNGIQ
ncbi:uncharacterized protein ISCGN_030296 [Ixodes scapularis]